MVDYTNARAILEDSLTRRVSTGVVADAILKLGVITSGTSLHRELTALVYEAQWAGHDDFDQVDSVDDQMVTFIQLFPNLNVQEAGKKGVYDSGYAAPYRVYVADALAELGVDSENAEQALTNRYNLDWKNGSATSKKAFTKRLRFLAHFEQKLDRFEDVLKLRHAQMQAKSRLAYAVQADTLDDESLAFVAYLAARANRRSLFMLGGQSKAFDNISDGLRSILPEDAAWEQIALVSPTTNVFKHLDPETLGRLIGVFHQEMSVAAGELGKLFPSLPERMRQEMVMVKGVDSSRWNAYAGALNTMRSAWISATLAAGLGNIFDVYLPGKAPRLIASDLVWWARNEGQELHEDTRMFSALPYPWEVVVGEKTLNRDAILAAAKQVNAVEVEKSGWVGPRTDVKSEIAEAELPSVHGIIVSDPHFAQLLRKQGYFSGKFIKNGGEVALNRINFDDGERMYAAAF